MTRSRAPLFLLASFTVLAAVLIILHTQRFAANVDVGSWGITFDLTITIPALYYFFVVRSGRARVLTIAPVFLVCALVATQIVPRDQQQFLHQLRFALAPLDLITIYLVVRRLRAGAKPDGVVASFVVTELAILRYALFAWREQPRVPQGTTPVTVHQRSGWGTIVVCFLVLIVFESVGAHLLVSMWSTKAAWIVTALDVYGMLWLIGDYHALRLRPTLIGTDSIELRYGMRWSAAIARENIAAIEAIQSEADWKRRTTLKMALLEEPRTLIRLREPIVVHGLAGIRKTVDSIAILPDDEASFSAALSSRA